VQEGDGAHSCTERRLALLMKHEMGDAKQQWVHTQAERLLQRWLTRKGPVCISFEYVRQLERDLTHFYGQPLLKAFIENTD
jgi:hypothetical protein